jgi:hypothetical protein
MQRSEMAEQRLAIISFSNRKKGQRPSPPHRIEDADLCQRQ